MKLKDFSQKLQELNEKFHPRSRLYVCFSDSCNYSNEMKFILLHLDYDITLDGLNEIASVMIDDFDENSDVYIIGSHCDEIKPVEEVLGWLN